MDTVPSDFLQLSALQSLLGVALFEPAVHGIQPTHLGSKLARLAPEVLLHMDRLDRYVKVRERSAVACTGIKMKDTPGKSWFACALRG